jgi:hypothetical protein
MNTIELFLKREHLHELATLGQITRDGKLVCYTLEDKDRGLTNETPLSEVKAKKVYGQTAIPTGRYKVVKVFSPKHKRIMPLLLDVHGFVGIEMHGGNTVADSLGCILCAHTQDIAHDRIQGKAESDIMLILDEGERDHKEVWITIGY